MSDAKALGSPAPAAGASSAAGGLTALHSRACDCWASRMYRSFVVSVDTKGGLDKFLRCGAYGARLAESLLDRFVLQPQRIEQQRLSDAHKAALVAAGKPLPPANVPPNGMSQGLPNFLNKLKLIESHLSAVRRGTRLPGLPSQWKVVCDSLANRTLVGRLNTLRHAAMLPYFPLDNAFWLLRTGAVTGLDVMFVGRSSVFFWGLSLLFALCINYLKLRAAYRLAAALAAIRRVQRAYQQQQQQQQSAAGGGSGGSGIASPITAQETTTANASADAQLIKRLDGALQASSRVGGSGGLNDALLLASLQANGVRTADSVALVNARAGGVATELHNQWVDCIKNLTDMVVALSECYFDWSRLTTGVFGTVASVLGWYATWPPAPKA